MPLNLGLSCLGIAFVTPLIYAVVIGNRYLNQKRLGQEHLINKLSIAVAGFGAALACLFVALTGYEESNSPYLLYSGVSGGALGSVVTWIIYVMVRPPRPLLWSVASFLILAPAIAIVPWISSEIN